MPIADALATRTVNGKSASFQTVDSGWGVYYRSNLSAAENRIHLKRAAEYFRKYSQDDGGGQETMLEQSMGSLGYTYLRDRVPKLMPHLVGFQLIDKNEERTKAFGAFAFRMNGKWFVVPVVFSRGDLKGHEMLWAKAEDIFVPLREGWVNYFQSNQSYSLGKSGPRNGSAYSSDVPDVSRVMRPGGIFGKNSHWVQECLPMLAAAKERSPRLLRKFATPALDAMVKQSEKVAAAVLSLARARPVVKLGMDAAYPGLVDSIPNLIAAAAFPKTAVDLDPTDAEDMRAPEPAGDVSAIKPGPKLEVYFRETVSDVPKVVPDEVKEEAMRDGVAYVDNRADDEKSIVVDPMMTYENPTENGLYDMLVGDGKLAEAFIVAPRASDPGFRIAVMREGGKFYEGRAVEMWTVGGAKTLSEYVKAVDDLPKAEGGLDTYARYLLLSHKQDATIVSVRDKLSDSEYVVGCDYCCGSDQLSSNQPQQSPAPNHLWRAHHVTEDITDGRGNSRLLFGGDVRGIRRFGNDLLAAKEVRKIKIDNYSDAAKLPARLIDRALGVLKGFEPIELRKTASGRVIIDSKFGQEEVAPRIAPAVLMLHHGFSKAAAEEAADVGFVGRRLMVKYAQPPASLVAEHNIAPSFPEDPMGSEAVGRGYAPAQYATRELVDVPALTGAGMEQELDYFQQAEDTNQAISLAEHGAANGDKELMDFGVLASMAHIRGVKNFVDSNWQKFVDGMDSYGRVLLMMYLHPDDFSEEYGSQGLPQLEDALRNAFEISGDVALELAEKTLKPLGDSAAPIDLSAEN